MKLFSCPGQIDPSHGATPIRGGPVIDAAVGGLETALRRLHRRKRNKTATQAPKNQHYTSAPDWRGSVFKIVNCRAGGKLFANREPSNLKRICPSTGFCLVY